MQPDPTKRIQTAREALERLVGVDLTAVAPAQIVEPAPVVEVPAPIAADAALPVPDPLIVEVAVAPQLDARASREQS